MKIILYNGPPECGKDTAAKYLFNLNRFHGVPSVFERFSMPLKTAFTAITGTQCNEFFENSTYEPIKDQPLEILNGKTYRQWQIDFSEYFMKPLYGQDIFGKLFTKRLESYPKDAIVFVPDSGFKIEIAVLEASSIPTEDVLLARIHRKGKDFSRDSREYVFSDHFFSVDLSNNGTREQFEAKTASVLNNFLIQKTNPGLIVRGGVY